MLDRTCPPPFNPLHVFELEKPSAYRLINGIPFFELLSGTHPALRIELMFNSGHLYEKQEGLSFFTSRLLSSGTSTMNADDIEERLAAFGAFLDISSGQDHCNIAIYFLEKHTQPILSLLKEIIIDPVFPEEELEKLKAVQLNNLKVNREKTSYLATVSFRKHFFLHGHPYSHSMSEEAINSISREKIVDYYQNAFSLSNCSIFLSGGTGSGYFDFVNKIFGGTIRVKRELGVPSSPQYGKGRFHVQKEETLQASLRIGFPGLPLQHPDYYKLFFLNEVLGGYFGSRLMKNIREEKGYTYGIHSSLVALSKADYLMIGTDVREEVTESTLEEIHKEIFRLKTEFVRTEELEIVKNYLIGTFLNSVNTPFSAMNRFKSLYYHDLSPEFFQQLYSNIERINSETVVQIAQEMFNEDDFLTVVAG